MFESFCGIRSLPLACSGLDGKATDEEMGGLNANRFWPLGSDNLLCSAFADISLILSTISSLRLPSFRGGERILELLLLLLPTV